MLPGLCIAALTMLMPPSRTLALSMTMERGPGPFCPTVDVGGRPAERVRRLKGAVAGRRYWHVVLDVDTWWSGNNIYSAEIKEN